MTPHSPPAAKHSLVRRTVLGIILAEFVCIATLAAVSVVHERRVRLHAVDVMLQGRADSLFGAVQDAEDAGDNVMLDPREMVLTQGDLFAVFDQGGRLLGSSTNSLKDLLAGRDLGIHTRRFDGHTYRVLDRNNLRVIDRAESGGAGLERPISILYATPIDGVWREVFEAISFYLFASLLVIIGTTVFVVQMLRRLLQPLGELSAATAAVSPRELEFRAPPSALAVTELRPLASTLSAVLNELKSAFDRQHRFVGDASHELKTAVAVVRSSLQLLLLRRRTVPEYEAGLLRCVEDNERVEALISRMLLMARLEEKHAAGTAQSEIQEVAAECLHYLHNFAEIGGIRLVADFFGHRATVSSSALRFGETVTPNSRYLVGVPVEDLRVLINNLLLNAVQHSSAPDAVVLSLEAESSTVKLCVHDDGGGIPAADLPHIFERFYRADRSRARATGGAGLGLSIVKAVVDRAGGSIEIQSRSGDGTTVIVTFPLLAATSANTPTATSSFSSR